MSTWLSWEKGVMALRWDTSVIYPRKKKNIKKQPERNVFYLVRHIASVIYTVLYTKFKREKYIR